MLADWVKETISAGGTGALTLSGAVSSDFITWNTAFGTSREFLYEAVDGTSRETGLGHLTTSTNLVRDKIICTLTGGTLDNSSPAALNLSTSTLVYSPASAAGISIPAAAPNVTSFSSTNGFLPQNYSGADSNSGSVAGQRPTYWYINSPYSFELGKIGFNVAATAASTNAEWGLYDILSSGLPGKLLVTTGAVSVATSGMKLTSVGPIWLPAGWYIAAMVSNHATNNPTYTSAGTCHGAISPGSSASGVLKWRYDNTATSLPSTGHSTTLVAESDVSAPKIFLKPV